MNRFLVKHNIHLQPDEKVIVFTRKHWIKLLYDAGIIILLGAVAVAALINLAHGSGPVSPAAVFVVSLFQLVIWIALFIAWTNHYLDLWIVTNKRIIHIEQISLFHRTRTTIRLERVQNVSIRRRGIFEELLNFGTISVETAGYKTFMTEMHYIPNPSAIANSIMRHVDRVTDRDRENGVLADVTRTT